MATTLNQFSRQDIFSTLNAMGYEDLLIELAYKDSKNKTLEEILDLILINEANYNADLQKGAPSSNQESNSKVSSKSRSKKKAASSKVPNLQKS